MLFPLALVFYYSFNEWNVLAGTFKSVGGANYEKLLADPQLPSVLAATTVFSICLVGINIPLALLLAVLLNRQGKGITVFRTIFFSPVVVSVVAWTLVWGFMLQDNGGINGILQTFGITGPNWLRTGPTAMAAVVTTYVFKNVGLNMVLFLAALQGVPSELYEAAKVDGATRWVLLRRITLPLISPTLLLTIIITIVGSLQAFARSPCSLRAGQDCPQQSWSTTCSSRHSNSTILDMVQHFHSSSS